MRIVIFRSRYGIGRVNKQTPGASAQARRDRQRKVTYYVKRFLVVCFAGFFLFGVLGIFIVINISKGLPDVEGVSTYIPAETSKIFSEDGVVLAELHMEENRVLIPLENIAPVLQKIVVAVEDANFYDHHGIDFKGIIRAMFINMKAGRFVQGGSTLTQQLARNLFLHRRRTLSRKLAEAVLAVKIERRYTKPEILEMYLNQVYWGHNAYGIESASRLYFGKKAEELNISEAAMLVGLLKGPELYSPLKNYKRSKQRQKVVLQRMLATKLIDEQVYHDAFNYELELKPRQGFRYKAPYFTSYILKQLIDMYGEEAAYTSGIRVYTTLDYRMQQKAEQVVDKWVNYGNQPHWVKGEKVPSLNFQQGALLCLDPRSGYIKAMQGGYDFINNQFNHCTQAKRQPGSAFKPFVYLTALEKGMSPGYLMEDSPVTFNTIEGPYSPRNYTEEFSGNIPLRKALEKSINVIAIKLNYLLGPKTVVETAKRLGIQSPLKPILSLPLGANEVTMLELTKAYGVMANNGVRVEPTGIIRIEDRNGTVLYEHHREETRVVDGKYVSALVQMMQGVVKYGTGINSKLPRPSAGKTGTTSDYRDAWFAGFVPQLVCLTWIGNDDNTPTQRMVGGWVPALMWKEFMKTALVGVPAQDFPKPRGMVRVKVNWENGKKASEYSPKDKVFEELYWVGAEPKEVDTGVIEWKNDRESDPLESFFKTF
ncbi:MAG: penicillin-binding protein 1A [bacterium]